MPDLTPRGISQKWKDVAIGWLGNSEGKHCHWCKYHLSEEGEVTCIHPKSKYNDGDRIRTWDGEECAADCGYFDLEDWYKDDKNYDEYFK